jgi:hypothetical protein
MITIRRAGDRGRTEWDWLDSRHTFSFGDYFDPDHMGFGSLRVINDDRIAPGAGFGTHGHRDMEIFSWVLEGGLEHKDSMGNGNVIRPGQLQFMRAGRGVTHSEYNPSKEKPGHFLQIWIVPNARGLEPAYAELTPDPERLEREFVLMASPEGRDGSIAVAQNVDLWLTRLAAGRERKFEIRPGRNAWLHLATGAITLNGHELKAGDGAAIEAAGRLELRGLAGSEVLLFDLG